MLGNRNLSTLININSSSGDLFKSSALVVGYENRRTRFNWKLEGGQIPILSPRVSGVDSAPSTARTSSSKKRAASGR